MKACIRRSLDRRRLAPRLEQQRPEDEPSRSSDRRVDAREGVLAIIQRARY